jgi:hypothetical protein
MNQSIWQHCSTAAAACAILAGRRARRAIQHTSHSVIKFYAPCDVDLSFVELIHAFNRRIFLSTMRSASFVALSLWIVNLGTAFGAGIYETRMILPGWFPRPRGGQLGINSQLMRETDAGRRFWGMVTTLPLTLLTIANLYFALQSIGPPRLPWLLAVAAVTLERILTFAFFIPVAVQFMRLQAAAPPSAIALAAAWVNLNHIRNLLILTGWVGALYVHGMGP